MITTQTKKKLRGNQMTKEFFECPKCGYEADVTKVIEQCPACGADIDNGDINESDDYEDTL